MKPPVIRIGLLLAILVFVAAVWWLVEEAIVHGARWLDEATSGALSSIVDFLRALVPRRPLR